MWGPLSYLFRLIVVQPSEGTIDYPQKWVCLGQAISKFWHISENLCETIQDRDIVAMDKYQLSLMNQHHGKRAANKGGRSV